MSKLYSPLTFEPIFQERIWGGRKLTDLFGKTLPPDKRIGESWEIVDRPEAKSIVRSGPRAGRSLHDLWVNCREQVFGEVADAPRFPLLVKLLDCREKLSLQVHPPPEVAGALAGKQKPNAGLSPMPRRKRNSTLVCKNRPRRNNLSLQSKGGQ